MSGDITTSRDGIQGTNNVNINTFWDNTGNGPDSTSDQDQEPQQNTWVADVQEGVGSSANRDRQGMVDHGNKISTVSSTHQDMKMEIGGKTLMVRGNECFSQIQNMITKKDGVKWTCQLC